ncbi:hypothetical protein OJAV_G00045630 [Oryzias javanicus]|uniref:Uncharacterized protein n=1 Tax=Oryzias javanicus TaxID=123683 RepID=A0A3S2PQD4_ORYJA|nr:hypothetical protein OJAV_G00045630 [Oryzias javanicus]
MHILNKVAKMNVNLNRNALVILLYRGGILEKRKTKLSGWVYIAKPPITTAERLLDVAQQSQEVSANVKNILGCKRQFDKC